MKLIGIKNSVSFKNQVLNQREVIQVNSTNEKTHILLEEIRDLLSDIKNKQ